MTSPDSPRRLEELARKWLEGSITPAEQEEFARWYNREQDRPVPIPASSAECEEDHRRQILTGIRNRIRPRRSVNWRKPAAAAAIVLLTAGIAAYLLVNRDTPAPPATLAQAPAGDALPGGDKAILTFEDGHSLSLDGVPNGILKDEKDIRIRKDGGMIIYEALGAPRPETAYNTISTPRGGQYTLRLPDGSTVWLNSASSLRYPTRFAGDDRTVELTGEAFFDIVTSPTGPGGSKSPFLVNVNKKQTVKVLGTQFNINGYEDEASVKTTLLKGSVEILGNRGESAYLRPNQQSTLHENGRLTVTDHVDIEEALAWKNGLLLFKDTDIRDIMRQIARWYDVDIVYRDDIPTRLFTGGISRDSKLSSLLRILETSGIHFEVEEKKIIVTF